VHLCHGLARVQHLDGLGKLGDDVTGRVSLGLPKPSSAVLLSSMVGLLAVEADQLR
jgi:hypothetical protein